MAAGLVALLCLGYPIVTTALFAYASFSGCFISCGPREPGVGLVWSAATALLVFAPIALGLALAGVRSRAAWWCTVAVVLLAVAGWDLVALAS